MHENYVNYFLASSHAFQFLTALEFLTWGLGSRAKENMAVVRCNIVQLKKKKMMFSFCIPPQASLEMQIGGPYVHLQFYLV